MIGTHMVGRIRSMALCVLVLLLACPATAFALVGPVDVESSGWNDEPYIAYTLAPDQFTAACNFCNVDTDMLNTAQRDYLSSSDDWLAFQHACTENNDFSIAMLAFPFYAKGPDENLYEVYVDGPVKGKAYSVLMDVLKGDVSNLTYDGDMTIFPGQCWLANSGGSSFTSGGVTYQFSINPSSGRVGMPDFVDVAVPTTYLEQLQAVYPEADTLVVSISTQSNVLVYNLLAFVGSQGDFIYANNHDIRKLREIKVNAGTRYAIYSFPMGTASYDGTIVCGTSNKRPTIETSKGSSIIYQTPASGISATVSINTDPDPQPDPPIQPTDPGTDVPTVDPPTWPTIDFPDITIHGAPITITWPTIADNADYTQLLKEIIKRLEKIGDLCGDIINDMDEHCEHLQQAIQDAAEYIVDNLELGIDPDLDDLVRGIDNAWRKITQTIKEQVKWLADQLDYDFTVTLDLDKIEQYLRRIISKMGGGTSKPDPTTDPFSWGDWLNDLWTKIFTALQIALPDELGELLELFDILKTKFPFSVPFDLIAIVALFDHAPVTPVFDLPYPMLLATGVGYDTVTIDCSGWNSTMVMVRDLEVVLFTAYLISRTEWAMDAINPKKGK